MGKKVTLTVQTRNCYNGMTTNHKLEIRVLPEVLNNKVRFKSHCDIIAKKTFGKTALVKYICVHGE